MAKETVLSIDTLERGSVTVVLKGQTGMYHHKMSAKAKHQLLLGGRKKTAAERQQIKHDPYAEYRDSMHIKRDLFEGTNVVFPAMGIKSAMATSALSVAGVTKANVQRLIFIKDEFVPIFGIPFMRMDVTRSADQNRTPDVRTRAFMPAWYTRCTIEFGKPALSIESILTLLVNAGVVCGIGDFRQEKGKGSFGTFEPTNDPIPAEFMDKEAQWAAIEKPTTFDDETTDLLALYDAAYEKQAA